MNPRAAIVLVALLFAGACAEPLEFADWTVPVPEGLAVVEYAHVPFEERGNAMIEWVDELVIGDRGDSDLRYAFTYPYDVAVDRLGQIYVADMLAGDVRLFDENGVYLRNLSRKGQGPGEFQNPDAVVALDDRVIVLAYGNNRLSHFDLEGNHLADYPVTSSDNLELFDTRPDGNLVAATTRFNRETGVEHIDREALVYSPQAEKLASYAAGSYPTPGPAIDGNGRRAYLQSMPNAIWQATASRDGAVYWTMSDEYQVLAVGPDTRPRWALRVAWGPPALPRAQIDEIMEAAREVYADVAESEVNFPDRQPAIHRIRVDGHGHLYVYPYVHGPLPEAGGDPTALVPVDVYAPDGERLFTGMAPPRYWTLAEGDHVWEIVIDPDTEEWVVRKSRLVEPFDT